MAMVNVDFSPSLLLGLGMIGGGLALYQVRLSRPWISRDYDVVISSIAILTGGILVFQGWRLDPLLLFGQLLTAGTATAFAVESLRLRDVISEETSEEQEVMRVQRDQGSPQQWGLPPPQAQSFEDFQQNASTEYSDQERWNTSQAAGGRQQDDYQDQRWDDRGQQYYVETEDRAYAQSAPDQYLPADYADVDGQFAGDEEPDNRRTRSTWGKAAEYDSVEDW